MKQSEIDDLSLIFADLYGLTGGIPALQAAVAQAQADITTLFAQIAVLPTVTEVDAQIADWIANNLPTFSTADVPEYPA